MLEEGESNSPFSRLSKQKRALAGLAPFLHAGWWSSHLRIGTELETDFQQHRRNPEWL
jgi:hypothetical protein